MLAPKSTITFAEDCLVACQGAIPSFRRPPLDNSPLIDKAFAWPPSSIRVASTDLAGSDKTPIRGALKQSGGNFGQNLLFPMPIAA
jgi:hypothetical protein